jgi:L-arabinose transport system ATP-binding protein
MYRLIVDLAKRGSAVILISDEIPELIGLADRIMVMQNGRISHEFTKGNVSEEELLAAILGHNIQERSKNQFPEDMRQLDR